MNPSVTVTEPTSVVKSHRQCRGQVKIQVEVARVGPSTFKEVILVDPGSTHLLSSFRLEASQPLFCGQAYCASCAGIQVSDARLQCSPDIATFKIPSRCRKRVNGQWFRGDLESLMYAFLLLLSSRIDPLVCSISFALKDSLGNNVVTYQVEAPFKARTHARVRMQIPTQLPSFGHYQPVQPTVLAFPQPSPNLGSTEVTIPPPLPRIVDIIPRIGPHYASQKLWVKVQNLPRGAGLQYLIGFGNGDTMRTSFVCSEGDQVQILECATPITSAACFVYPWLMQHHNPHIPIGFSDVHYTFASDSFS